MVLLEIARLVLRNQFPKSLKTHIVFSLVRVAHISPAGKRHGVAGISLCCLKHRAVPRAKSHLSGSCLEFVHLVFFAAKGAVHKVSPWLNSRSFP